MSNGEVCCLLQVCCPPELRRQRGAEKIAADTGCSEDHAGKVLDWFDERFDLAPKGTVQPLIEAIATMARKHPV